MNLTQAAEQFNKQFPGLNVASGASPAQVRDAMQALVTLAAASETPTSFAHLDAVVASIAELAPRSALSFNELIVENRSQAEFAKALELAFAVMESRSPETWKHILNHTALTMLYYERETALGDTPDPSRTGQLLTLLVGALGHDIGKAGLDPELLHKAARVKPERFTEAAEHYKILVPDYPEKMHDLIFLEEAHKGRLIFADSGQPKPAERKPGDRILDIGKDLRRSESYWVDDAERQRHNAMWERINAKANEHIPKLNPNGWLNEAEQQALTMAERGTVTPEEKKIIESHDAMSEAFFRQVKLPDAVRGARDIVSMDTYRKADQQHSVLGDIVHTMDVFEALTADRSYRAAYSPEEAVKVMEGMAKEGKVSGKVIESMKANGTLGIYATKTSLQHSVDITLATLMPQIDKSWVERVMGFNPIREIAFMLNEGLAPRSGVALAP